ncbi:tyrosine-type recombinase/integrase [Nocardia sp. CA-107356]|uniref:tyrosine-type recombinase/integrase n=1 Tax=Nocardia sp. CA-107356 TaxID=3239972 RepID=UPI003D904F34
MSIRTQVEAYLAMRRALGYQLRAEGRMLLDFADRLDAAGQPTITVSAALAWAIEPRNAAPAHWCRRLGVVRGFARHLHTLDPDCQVPPADLLAGPTHRPTPYIYTEQEISALVHAAQTIAAPMPAATCHAVISLIAASGLRLGETLALDRGDVDLDAGILTVVGKNQHTRLIPLHPSTTQMLGRYAERRDRLCPATGSASFFLTTRGHRPQPSSLQHTFAKLLVLAEIPTPPGRRRPRIHDLRHSFAVNTLIDWYRSGADVAARMPILSTYLGHSGGPEATYWYLQATPELLALAAERLEHHRRTS